MLSSISNSNFVAEQRSFRKAVATLLAAIALLLCSGEIGIHFAYRKWSVIEGRIARESSQASAIRRVSDAPPLILFLGNSLLLEALDEPTLSDRLAPRARVQRFAIEGTGFQDWHYGIRRLIAEGSRPDAIVLCMSAAGLMTSDIRGDYSSYYLFSLRDIPAVKSELHYDLTKTSSLLLAHYSLFYAARNNYRVFVMNQIDMPYSRIAQALGPHQPGTLPAGNTLVQTLENRLRTLNNGLASSGIRLMLLIPPGSLPCDDELIEAGLRTGVDVIIPYRANVMPRTMFRDATHLNREGASLFTAAVEMELRTRLLSNNGGAK